jgi:hypothetical protein
MIRTFKISVICIAMFLFLGTITANAQLLQDSTTLNLIRKDIDCIYNQQFTEAQEIYLKIEKSYPGHPVVYLIRGIFTYWENYPLLTTNPAYSSFEKDLRECIQLSEKNKKTTYEAEYLLYNLCARGMLLKYYDDNNLVLQVIPLLTSSYKYLKQSFSFPNQCADLYYYTGIYNYYREAYPNVHPAYKTFARLFRSGNITNGLKELNNAAVDAVVLRAESYFTLTSIYLNFENNYEKALYYCKSLNEKYPANAIYRSLYIKNLLLIKQYNEAEKLIKASQKESENKFFQAQLFIFKGILEEKKYHDNKLAQQYYSIGITNLSHYGEYGNEFAAYAYFGLSRIADNKSEKNAGKKFRDKALALADFKKINFDK